MPPAPLRPCLGCRRALVRGDTRCDDCRRTYHRDRDKRRAPSPHRAVYHTARWKRLRARVVAEEPICRRCKALGLKGLHTLTREVDHIIPHGGALDPLCWDRDNLQGLCKPHHSEKTGHDGRRSTRLSSTQDTAPAESRREGAGKSLGSTGSNTAPEANTHGGGE